MKNLIELQGIKKYFPINYRLFDRKKKWVKAVDGVDIRIEKREVFSLVGESGSGKTTLANLILGITQPTEGNIFFKGKEISMMKNKDLKEFHKSISVVFQDPFSSLNPRMTIMDILKEPIMENIGVIKNKDLKEYINILLNKTALREEHLFRYAHEFSGGQRQRIAITRAIAAKPEFIVLDEPTSGLDVSIQAQILNLLLDLKEKYESISFLFISHDMAVIRYVSTRIAVMYKGKIVELANNSDLFNNPLHPYTKHLLESVPNFKSINKKSGKIKSKEFNTFSNVNENKNICNYYFKCHYRDRECLNCTQELHFVGNNHYTACNKIGGNLFKSEEIIK